MAQILQNAYEIAVNSVRPAISTVLHVNEMIVKRASVLKDNGWGKVNDILSTHYGTVAVHGVDSAAGIVDDLIEKYIPAEVEEVTFGKYCWLSPFGYWEDLSCEFNFKL